MLETTRKIMRVKQLSKQTKGLTCLDVSATKILVIAMAIGR